MDDLESLIKEVQALREYLQKRDAERNKNINLLLTMATVGAALFLIVRGLHELGWF